MTRLISAFFFPSVPLAHLAATCEEMEYFLGQENRQYPFRNSLLAYRGPLDLEVVERLQRDPAYVQEMADKVLVGYKVPGITRTPGRIERIARRLGFSPP